MLRYLEVSRLCRPARIRCRPALLYRPKSTSTEASTSAPIPPRSAASTTASVSASTSASASWRAHLARRRNATLASRPKNAPPSKLPDQETAMDQIQRGRAEGRDFAQAKQLAAERGERAGRTAASAGKARKRLFPSLRDPNSFKRGESSQSVKKPSAAGSQSAPVEEGMSTTETSLLTADPATGASPSLTSSTSIDEAAEASSSSQTKAPSRKGKERAVEKDTEITKAAAKLRRNPAGVQLLSPSLHKQLFPGRALPQAPSHLVDLSRTHLAANGLTPEGAATLAEINMDLPPLRGSNVRDHFTALGKSEAEPYLSLANRFVETTLPPMPEAWATEWPGWTKYNADGTVDAVSDLGDEQIVSFDVETLYKISPYPVMATAATPTHWYSWLCPTIFEEPPEEPAPIRPRWDKTVDPGRPNSLIPMFEQDGTARIVIGHNVGYDRARIKDEYNLENTSTRFLDTLSLHVATRGITSVQRPAWMKHRKSKRQQRDDEKGIREATMELLREIRPEWAEILDNMPEEPEEEPPVPEENEDGTGPKWEDVTSMNSLKEVAALHCGLRMDKSVRDRFSDGTVTHASQLRPELFDLLQYCADDVKITHDVYKKVFPLFLASCPHPASFAGALAMGSAILPVNEAWKEYLKNAEEMYRQMQTNVAANLRSLAEKLRLDGPTPGDVWHQQLDWKPKKARWLDEGPDAPQAAVNAVQAARGLQKGDGSASQIAPALVAQETPKEETSEEAEIEDASTAGAPASSRWFEALTEPGYQPAAKHAHIIVPLLLRMTFRGYPVVYLRDDYWCFRVPKAEAEQLATEHGDPVTPGETDAWLMEGDAEKYAFFRAAAVGKPRRKKLIAGPTKKMLGKEISGADPDLLARAFEGPDAGVEQIPKLAAEMKELHRDDVWRAQLQRLFPSETECSKAASKTKRSSSSSTAGSPEPVATWPAWYYELTRPASQLPPGEIDLSQKKSVAALLLRLSWDGYPLFLSKRFKWIYRVPSDHITSDLYTSDGAVKGHGEAVGWGDGPTSGDEELAQDTQHLYFRLPHPAGEGKNVGNPLSKMFVKFIESGKLATASGGDESAARIASEATQMSVLCSYWVSARERIMDQLVVYDTPTSGIILPQVITMGTVTRRAVESTWLTASNAKKNRVGSELKAMVRAPSGYALVGADVDSEELWISSVMGDSQFGMHGATAIGWMTLEGTKSAGTDLHSKTASILGTSRDAAKVFNYSRIYGAGVKHAVQLLMQGDPNLTKEAATEKAKALYSATKGEKSMRSKKLGPANAPSLWHGGSESFLFNTLEAIALSDRPTTPALGCGVTKALSRKYLDETSTYLPSRINWVVQSSGVDYLHLLIVSMSYLIKRYNIQARYLISVHDEVRYLAKDEDRYRTALALQIANAWTRALFCYNLGIDDVPQGVTFFSAVDIDHVLRKEVNMPCTTPSHPNAIPYGESVGIDQLLAKVSDLGEPTSYEANYVQTRNGPPVQLFTNIGSTAHYQFLKAQSERKGSRARMWLDKQTAVLDSRGLPVGAKLGKGKGARADRLRESTAHLNGRASADDIREALESFEEEVKVGRMRGAA